MPRNKGPRAQADHDLNETETLDPWERQPDESGPAFEAFATYRDQAGRRSLRKVGRELGKSGSLISKWSAEHQWTSRAAAWDREKDRRRREEDLQATEAMSRRQATAAAALQQALLEPVQAFLRRIQEARAADRDPFAGYTLDQLARMSEQASRAFAQVATFERLARGLSTSNVGGHDGGPLPGSSEEARQWAATQPRDSLEAYLLGAADAQAVATRAAAADDATEGTTA